MKLAAAASSSTAPTLSSFGLGGVLYKLTG